MGLSPHPNSFAVTEPGDTLSFNTRQPACRTQSVCEREAVPESLCACSCSCNRLYTHPCGILGISIKCWGKHTLFEEDSGAPPSVPSTTCQAPELSRLVCQTCFGHSSHVSEPQASLYVHALLSTPFPVEAAAEKPWKRRQREGLLRSPAGSACGPGVQWDRDKIAKSHGSQQFSESPLSSCLPAHLINIMSLGWVWGRSGELHVHLCVCMDTHMGRV